MLTFESRTQWICLPIRGIGTSQFALLSVENHRVVTTESLSRQNTDRCFPHTIDTVCRDTRNDIRYPESAAIYHYVSFGSPSFPVDRFLGKIFHIESAHRIYCIDTMTYLRLPIRSRRSGSASEIGGITLEAEDRECLATALLFCFSGDHVRRDTRYDGGRGSRRGRRAAASTRPDKCSCSGAGTDDRTRAGCRRGAAGNTLAGS